MTKGLVLGIYSKDEEDGVPQFTSAVEDFAKLVAGKLREILNISGPPLKAGKTRTFYGLYIRTSPAWWWLALAKGQLESMIRRTGTKAKKTSELLLQLGAGRFRTWSCPLWRWTPVEILRLLRKELCLVSMNMVT
jgi:hypothetical protein